MPGRARRPPHVRRGGCGYILPVVNDRERLLSIYRERVAGYTGVRGDFLDRWLGWCRRVLAYGGDLVVPHVQPESDLDALLTHGALHGPKVRLVEGGRSCHANVAKLWIDGEIKAIGTGYALTDGLWRQHSWGLDDDTTVVETKSPCERYIGIHLPAGEPSVRFALSNYAGDIRRVLEQRTDRANEIVRVLRATHDARPVAQGAERSADVVWVVHDHPVIREPENYLVNVDLSVYGLDGQREQLWLRPIGSSVYEVTCIPFCVYGLAFLDRVTLTVDGTSVRHLLEPSGRRVLRILLMESYGERLPAVRDGIISIVSSLNLHSEWRAGRHVAIDVTRDVPLDGLFHMLANDVAAQHAHWEWGDALAFVPPK